MTMSSWMPYALIALVLWGFAGLAQKLSTNHISAELSFVWFAAAFVPIAGLILWRHSLDWKISGLAWLLAILAGALNGAGTLTAFAAYRSGGKASIVTPLTALYPVITIALAVTFLRERIGLREGLGIVLALAAAVALSYEGNSKSEL